MDEVQQNSSVGSQWELKKVDEIKSHDLWFSIPNVSWECVPTQEDFPEWVQYSEAKKQFLDNYTGEDKSEAEITKEFLVKNGYYPKGFDEYMEKEAEDKLNEVLNKHGLKLEYDEEGNKKPIKITTKEQVHDMQKMDNDLDVTYKNKYEEMAEEQKCKKVPKDPNIIDKHLWFKIVCIKNETEYRECLAFTKASTLRPPVSLALGGGVAIFRGWIPPNEREIVWYEALPIWNGNKKFKKTKVLEAMKSFCYDAFPKNLAPMANAILKKAGFVDVSDK